MIKLLTSLAGEDYSYNFGQIVELDAKTEKALIKSGQAEKITTKAKPKAKAKK